MQFYGLQHILQTDCRRSVSQETLQQSYQGYLGPLHFIIYIDDLQLHLTTSETDIFADDTTLTASGFTIQDLKRNFKLTHTI